MIKLVGKSIFLSNREAVEAVAHARNTRESKETAYHQAARRFTKSVKDVCLHFLHWVSLGF
jgi:hypothetical protein